MLQGDNEVHKMFYYLFTVNNVWNVSPLDRK